jgi:hypothetical protein
VICNPCNNALLKPGNKSDQIDARKLVGIRRTDLLSPLYLAREQYSDLAFSAASLIFTNSSFPRRCSAPL